MFTKLRNQFLVVNMVTIFVIMLVAFSSIYMIMCQKVNSDINAELQGVYSLYHKSYKNSDPPPSESPKESLSLCFEVETDSQWNITGTESQFNFSREFYELVADKVSAKNEVEGQFHVKEKNWAYIVKEEKSGYAIYAVDITAQLSLMNNLIYTFILVGILMFIVIFFTNRYFANRYIAPVKEAFIKQKQFITDASHELKTPLTVINTNTDLLLSNSEDTIQNQAKWLHHIKGETERMKSLTNDLLYLTEIDHSRNQKIFAPFSMSEAVESIILTMEAILFEKNIKLNYEIQPDLKVYGNKEQIKQVVMILLDNAVKYTNPTGTITITLKKQSQDTVLSVTNTGDGISSEHIEKIFDRFYRTDPSRSRQQGGYGLGLAIAKSIVEQHKGKIYAKSKQNESTTFFVHLS
ncbi:sensor histidine kinase [Metabacillus litoralis]|uniref:sensor histidine kinase n=1 Tax=Metabacillus litoralis TaxID=152268 RepID=UPI00203F0E45|nr:HAMP domain-containing sensor histidine kinase [Metabacillus litoralis]MCM3410285.1 HAMP domain-containing histidine kinase [Metabacillus litoralis]